MKPRYRYLTRSFVEALGLKHIPIRLRRNCGIAFISEHEAMPMPQKQYATGVVFEGYGYVREDDGLAWAWTGARS